MPRTEVEPYDVIVIGGGASGLAAALSAARAGARAAVVERDVACGLPILSTGNGRCNLSNTLLHPGHYRHPEAARTVMGATPEEDLAAWFHSIGLATCREGNLLFPMSKRAESVRDALLAACERSGVELICCCEPVRATWREGSAVQEPREAATAERGAWKLDVLAPTRPLRAHRARDAKAELRALRKALSVAPKRSHALFARTVVLAPGGSSEGVCQLFDLSLIHI